MLPTKRRDAYPRPFLIFRIPVEAKILKVLHHAAVLESKFRYRKSEYGWTALGVEIVEESMTHLMSRLRIITAARIVPDREPAHFKWQIPTPEQHSQFGWADLEFSDSVRRVL